MGDGWETKRSRTPGHKDWVIIKLQVFLNNLIAIPVIIFFSMISGEPGLLEKVEIDTAHFKGNFPESVELHAVQSDQVGLVPYI